MSMDDNNILVLYMRMLERGSEENTKPKRVVLSKDRVLQIRKMFKMIMRIYVYT